MNYDLELEKLKSYLKEHNCKTIVLQFPDGLKVFADKVIDELDKMNQEEGTDVMPIIWFGTCFGACDIPLGLNQFKTDLFVQWGHNVFNRVEGWK
ncbi:diphthamide synthesis protein [Candidatus Woesearchaeota archaeon]|nr:diphthamide synthesis protein [Candidatus Woesearchaeota archaeon]